MNRTIYFTIASAFIILLASFSSAGLSVGYNSNDSIKVDITSPKVITSSSGSGGNSSFNQTFTDATYLRLDASNDPVTGELVINNNVAINQSSASVALDVQGTGVFDKIGIGVNPNTGNQLMSTAAGNVITTSYSVTNTYNGTGATLRGMVFNVIQNGSNNNPTTQGITTSITYIGNGTGRITIEGTNFNANLANTKTATQGNYFIYGMKAFVGTVNLTTNHTGANFTTISIFAGEPIWFSNNSRQTSYSILAEGDVATMADSKLLFEGNETRKGTHFMVFNTTGGQALQTWVNNSLRISMNRTANLFFGNRTGFETFQPRATVEINGTLVVSGIAPKVGIGTTNITTLLDVMGLMRLNVTILPTCNASISGAIGYNESGHYGCHADGWNRLY